ncbi:MAG: thiazole biosynthesis protein, partial [Candidatus Aegiribacteria sp.]|nr:thiazole biosynthesis protein [Candidatus Aegiribacteria sp.]MBD3295693.1 thiazole biosynthesis protein [Candidatus Fermentibacteria bacterium]
MGRLEEVQITRAIVDTFSRNLLSDLELDVAIAGGGPAGLTAARELALKGHRVALFERKLSLGGGMWGGGMGYSVIVVQEEGRRILSEIGVELEKYSEGYFTAGSVEAVSVLVSEACRAGASIYNLFTVEDLMVESGRITGIVVTSSPIEMAGLHVDPVCISAKYVIE